jgi:hypothetical protein
MASESSFSKGWKQFVDHEWIKNKWILKFSAHDKASSFLTLNLAARLNQKPVQTGQLS